MNTDEEKKTQGKQPRMSTDRERNEGEDEAKGEGRDMYGTNVRE
jgi:hypothetical protein